MTPYQCKMLNFKENSDVHSFVDGGSILYNNSNTIDFTL
jgi:hypothetical protein